MFPVNLALVSSLLLFSQFFTRGSPLLLPPSLLLWPRTESCTALCQAPPIIIYLSLKVSRVGASVLDKKSHASQSMGYAAGTASTGYTLETSQLHASLFCSLIHWKTTVWQVFCGPFKHGSLQSSGRSSKHLITWIFLSIQLQHFQLDGNSNYWF